MAVKKIAVPGALLQIIVVTALGFMVASYWDLSTIGAIIFGLSLSVASTVVLLRVLESKGLLETANGQIAVGWLVVEDRLPQQQSHAKQRPLLYLLRRLGLHVPELIAGRGRCQLGPTQNDWEWFLDNLLQ
jgi:hypothetical protein